MTASSKPLAAESAGSAKSFPFFRESPRREYFLCAILATGLHAGLIFGWQRNSEFEPAEYGVVNGESAIEVALIPAPPETQEIEEPIEAQAEIAPAEASKTEETKPEVVEPPEVPVSNMVREMPQPESTPQGRPVPARAPPVPASKPKAVSNRKERSTAGAASSETGSNSQAFHSASGVRASKPAYLYNPHPPYPEAARKAAQTGVVMLRVSINEKGRVSSVDLIRSSGHSLLDDRALTAVQRWVFRPARRNGKPVATQVDVPVRFSLDR